MTNQPRPQMQVLERPQYPSGVPLTDSMELTDRDGSHWLAYIEGVPLPRRRRWARSGGLPGRRLRFDSAAGSRVISPVPAGSPFLPDARLQDLLDRSEALDSSVPLAPTPAGRGRRSATSSLVKSARDLLSRLQFA